VRQHSEYVLSALAILLPIFALGCSSEAARIAPALSAQPLTIEITSSSASAPGGIRSAIEAANRAGVATRIVSKLDPGTEVEVVTALPTLVAADTVFDANGLLLKGGACVRPGGREGCDGLVVGGPRIRVNDLRAHGFTFDGIAVRGRRAVDVLINDCHCFDNKDDGVGVSNRATGVVVQRCLLEGNGFRTKGKGILVFDYAEAELRDNVVRGNRDGVTISRRAKAQLLGNKIVSNYDKGFGVAGGEASGKGNVVERSGRGMTGLDPPPNADGIRVTLDSTVRLAETVVADNGDSGVVVIGSAALVMLGGSIVGNGGVGVRGADRASIELRNVEVGGNREGARSLDDQARLDQFP
jgi:hypothetical protein